MPALTVGMFLVVLVGSLVFLAPLSHGAATGSTAVGAPPCPDEKPGVPQGCPTYPPGYQPAAKAAAPGFSPLPPAPSPSFLSPPGSITDAPPPFSSQQFVTQNSWWDVVGGESYQVWAGSEASDASQGVVIIMAGPASDTSHAGNYTLQAFPTPTQHGPVSITASTGTVLTLTSSDGTTFTFDVLANAYVGG